MDINQVITRNFHVISPEYKEFALNKSQCKSCSVFNCYKQVGQSEGNALNPTFMFIGEALGSDEVANVRPFIGKAGQRLRAEMKKYPNVFNKETTILTNVLSCRPPNNKFPSDYKNDNDEKQTWTIQSKPPVNKKVKARELVNFCASKWVRQEIAMLKPKVIVTFGSVALDYIRGDRGITEHRGSWKFLPQHRAWSMATFHPSYVLRCENDEAKQYIADEFRSDIETVATTWRSIVEMDERMSMTDEEWKLEQQTDCAIKSKLLKATAGIDFSQFEKNDA